MADTPVLEDGNPSLKWYQGLDRYCWIVLAIAAFAWLFDTMDQNLYNLVRPASMRQLLMAQFTNPATHAVNEVALKAAADQKGAWINAVFLLGWGIGGLAFGVIGDRMGRVRTMVTTILIYAVFTGLSGLAWNWQIYAVARFLTAIGVGGEWAAGASLVAEVFPQRLRGMALGSLQALSALGNMMACIITLIIGNLDKYWHIAYFIGFLPALLVFWIVRSVKEPETWQQARDKAPLGKQLGSFTELFSNPRLRHNSIVAMLLATAGIGGLWCIAFFSTNLIDGELRAAKWDKTSIGRCISVMFLIQQFGAFVGIYLFAIVAERLSRRSAFAIWFALAWGAVLLFFWSLAGTGGKAFLLSLPLSFLLGFGTLGPFSGFSIYFPELFPTRLRNTGCGVGYNAARILAAPASLIIGNLTIWFTRRGFTGGNSFAMAATVVSFIYVVGLVALIFAPETKGRGFPEDSVFEEPAVVVKA